MEQAIEKTDSSIIDNRDTSSDVFNNTITLELGDIIEMIAPSNPSLHEITMFISYISAGMIQITNISSLKQFQLNINENGRLSDESIVQINLLSRSEEKGYARQNNLVPRTWVNIHFGGEIPVIIAGEITNLEEDMIEVITYPELKTIYIDFQYQGIPKDIPIETIMIREKPASLKSVGSLSLLRDSLEEGEDYEIPDTEVADIQFTETGESIITIPEGSKEVKNMRDVLHEVYVDANTIVFGERLEEIAHVIEVPVNERRYGIDEQVDDMMDELLSTVPNTQRTKLVMDNIHNLIERFVELRERFSKVDGNQNVYGAKTMGEHYKPLLQRIMKFDSNLRWLIPIVMNKRKLYDLEVAPTNADIISETSHEVLSAISEIQTNYYTNATTNNVNTFQTMNNNLHLPLTPFSATDNIENCLTNSLVMTNLDAIVDNLEDFASSVYTQSGIAKRKYVIQRYNLGLSRITEDIMKSGKKVYTRTNMTPNDSICLKSLVMMPASIIKLSTIYLPGTNILDRATMHDQYMMLFRLFKKNMELTPHVIDDLSKELDFERMEAETKKDLLSGLHEFVLDREVYVDSNEKLERFLEVIIPKTKLLIRLFRKYMKNKLSFEGVVRQLEAFSIYPSDISYKQSQEIRSIIRDQIKELKIRIEQKSNEVGFAMNAKYSVIRLPNVITRIFDEDESVREMFRGSYKLSKNQNEETLSTREIMSKMIELDNGLLYTSMLNTITESLITPKNLIKSLENNNIDDTTEEDQVKTIDCAKLYLAKKYTSLRTLQADNSVDELYFDKDLDDTPYSILQKYKAEQKKLAPELFMEYLIANLIEKHGSPKSIAPVLAKTLIANKKLVEDGHYAILETHSPAQTGATEENPSKNIIYFRRLRGNWVKDNDIDPISFLDTSTLFCNINNDCVKNQTNNLCESSADVRKRIKRTANSEIMDELKTRYNKTADEISQEHKDRVEAQMKLLKRLHILREVQLYKSNNLAYAIGNYANTNSSIQSPHEKLKAAILGYPDFQSRQKYICQFVEEKCREPMVSNLDEHPHWFYCKDTNVKLFPKSLHELAIAFVLGDNYSETLQEVCARVGLLSDDGDSIIDRYSGVVLRKIDYQTEEMFDEAGFRIATHSVMEKDLGDVVMETKTPKIMNKIFDNEITEQIYNVSKTICRNIDIPMDSIEEFVLRISNEIIVKDILSESAYKRRSEASMNKTGKALSPYINYKNEITILIIASVLIVAVQTAIPMFSGSKTFPGCVRSFAGFPLEGVEDLTAIQYIACVISKVKSSIAPWDSVQKYKVDKIASRIKDVLEKSVLPMSEVDALYAKKREYLVSHPILSVPAEHALTKWVHCLPPIVEIAVLKTLKPVSSDFKQELMDLVRKGSHKQDDSIQVLKGKIVQHSYGLIESINASIKAKDLLLKTSSELPFLENACCNEAIDKIKPMVYFMTEDTNIRLLLQRTFSMTKLLKTVQSLNHASMFYHPLATGMKYPDVPTGHLEENLYAAVIYYCNFDKKLPIPEEFKVICNEKPAQYNSSWSLLEKMEFMKMNGKRYTVDTLHRLMTIVNRQNMVSVDAAMPLSKVQILSELLEKLDMIDSPVVDERLRAHLRNVIHQYNPAVMRDTPSKELNDLTNYLTVSNKKIYMNIMNFFHAHGKLAPNVYKNVNQYIAKIASWTNDADTKGSHHESTYTFAQFIQNSVQNISKIYPTILINNAEFYKQVPTHWGLSSNHVMDIQTFMSKYYNNLAAFRQDNVIMELVSEVRNSLSDMILFLQNIPVYNDIVKDIVDEKGQPKQIRFYSFMNSETVSLLLTHCYYQCINQYIRLSDDPDLLQVDIYQSKLVRRGQIADNMDESLQLRSQDVADEGVADMENEMNEINITTTNPAELKKRVAELLITMFNIESSSKATIDVSYKDIMKKVMRSREKEKQGIIQYLGKMSIPERKIEDQFKQYKLGRWNVGKQKGLVSYDKETYERERGEILNQMNMELNVGNLDVVSEMRREIYDIERDAEQDAEATYDQEAYDIRNLDEDYMDGIYYAEDYNEDRE